MGNLIEWRNITGTGARPLPHFGDPRAEFEAARTAAVVMPATRYRLLLVHGADARDFLHNQLTCEVGRATPDRAVPGGYCTPKGRLLATFVLAAVPEGYLMLVPADIAEPLAARLRKFILRAKVRVETDGGWQVLGLAGPGAADVLQREMGVHAGHAFAAATRKDLAVVRLGDVGYIVFAPAAAMDATWQTLAQQALPAGDDCWEWIQVRARMPWIVAATQEQFLPQMVDLDAIGGVSFEKGCYPGQEIVARARYLGEVKRKLVRAATPGHPLAGDTLQSGGLPAGTVLVAAEVPDQGAALLVVVGEQVADLTLADGTPVRLSP